MRETKPKLVDIDPEVHYSKVTWIPHIGGRDVQIHSPVNDRYTENRCQSFIVYISYTYKMLRFLKPYKPVLHIGLLIQINVKILKSLYM